MMNIILFFFRVKQVRLFWKTIHEAGLCLFFFSIKKREGKCKKKNCEKKLKHCCITADFFFQSGLDLKLVIELGNLKKKLLSEATLIPPPSSNRMMLIKTPARGLSKTFITSEAPCWNIFWQWSWSFRIINSWCNCNVSKYFKTCIDFHTYSTFLVKIIFYPPIRNNKI